MKQADEMLQVDALTTDVNAWVPQSQTELAALRQLFQIRVPEHFNMGDAAVGRHARGAHKDRIALVDTSGDLDRCYTFAELDRQAGRCARFLRQLGVGRTGGGLLRAPGI